MKKKAKKLDKGRRQWKLSVKLRAPARSDKTKDTKSFEILRWASILMPLLTLAASC